jgi:hypothetical protein
MLRLIVLLLLLANGLYYAWSHGLLQAYGLAPVQQTEPQRLTQQLHPERLRLLGADEVKRLEAATAQTSLPPRPTECLQAGLYDERQATALRQALDTALPQGSWEFENGVEPERWIVYMGKYPDNDTLNKKLAELRSLNIRFEPLSNPALSPGLSLAAYPSEAAAKDGLAQFASRGVRTARVVQERAELRGQWLRLPQADASLKQRLDNLKAALAGKALRPCQKTLHPCSNPLMTLKLYFAPGACSFVPHVLLEASGATFEPVMVKLHKGEQQSPEYRAINPRAQVPVLVDGAEVITQILAIIGYLNDRFPQSGFLPAEPLARARAMETLAWMNNTVHPAFTHIVMPQKFSGQSGRA